MRRLGLALLAGGLALLPARALARNVGLAVEGCDGCHGGGRMPMVAITAEPMAPEPSASVLLTVRIQRANGNTGGFYLVSSRQGTLSAISGQLVRILNANE